jgi:hypothetical protein
MTTVRLHSARLPVPVDSFDRVVMRAVACQVYGSSVDPSACFSASAARTFRLAAFEDVTSFCLMARPALTSTIGPPLGSRVVIYQGVTIGRSEVWRPEAGEAGASSSRTTLSWAPEPRSSTPPTP